MDTSKRGLLFVNLEKVRCVFTLVIIIITGGLPHYLFASEVTFEVGVRLYRGSTQNCDSLQSIEDMKSLDAILESLFPITETITLAANDTMEIDTASFVDFVEDCIEDNCMLFFEFTITSIEQDIPVSIERWEKGEKPEQEIRFGTGYYSRENPIRKEKYKPRLDRFRWVNCQSALAARAGIYIFEFQIMGIPYYFTFNFES